MKNFFLKINKRKIFYLNWLLLAIIISLLTFNQIIFYKIEKGLGVNLSFFQIVKAKISFSPKLSGNLSEDAFKLAFSQGQPEIYGEELQISFDEVQKAINILKSFDPSYGKRKIKLENEEKKRYIKIGSKIACEYCCGAKSLVFQNGKAACGCAHAQAMRGLLAYLIKNHGQEYSDDELLRELARWKGRFFPKQMTKKIAQEIQTGQFSPEVAALVLDLKLPDYGQGKKEVPLPSEIQNLPSMVGGC